VEYQSSFYYHYVTVCQEPNNKLAIIIRDSSSQNSGFLINFIDQYNNSLYYFNVCYLYSRARECCQLRIIATSFVISRLDHYFCFAWPNCPLPFKMTFLSDSCMFKIEYNRTKYASLSERWMINTNLYPW